MTDLRPGVPANVAAALERALAKVPGDRFASCREFAAALADDMVLSPPAVAAAATVPTVAMRRPGPNALVRNAALIVLALAIGTFGTRALLALRAPSEVHSLAVLPLENLSGDESQQYFADGMTEELTAALSQITALRVISRTSVMGYQGTRKRLPQIARELNVDAVVEGAVRRQGDQVLVTAQLLDARQDRHLWGERYERRIADVLSLQGEIARVIAREVRVRLRPEERARLARARTVPPEAHEAYLRGRYLFGRMSESNFRDALNYFETAVRLDSTYAEAWSGIADAWYGMSSLYVPALEAMPRVQRAAARALALDPELASAHGSMATYLSCYAWNWSTGEAEYRRALALDPNNAWTHVTYATMLGAQRRFAESQAEWDKAIELDPLSLFSVVGAAQVALLRGDYPSAIRQYRSAIARDSTYAPARYMLGLTYLESARTSEALAELRKAVALADNLYAKALLGVALAQSGRKAEALAVAAELRAGNHGNVQPAYLAAIYAALGGNSEALDLLEESFNRRDEELINLAAYPQWRPLYSDPRFARLLKRLGLPLPPGVVAVDKT